MNTFWNSTVSSLSVTSQACRLYIPKLISSLSLAFFLLQLSCFSADSSFVYIAKARVEISAASGEVIEFRTQNGKEAAGKPSQKHSIPHLVLQRNGSQTQPKERSLSINVSGLPVPPSGATISLEVSTQHKMKERGHESPEHILVWQEIRWIPGSLSSSVNEHSVHFETLFKDLVIVNSQQITTPTDYFQIDIRMTDPGHPRNDPLFQYSQEYAFLMENQWLVDLPGAPGAAPSELMLYYYDMLPFQREAGESPSNFRRDMVNEYIKSEMIPALQKAFLTESIAWGFRWQPAWRSFRPGDPPNQISVALTDASTWYHGQAHARGSAAISLNMESEDNFRYQTLTDSLMSTFYHELFHNLQRSLNLHYGGDGDVDGLQDAWRFFSEGTAVLASSVGQPDIQFSPTHGMPVYFLEANGYFAGGGAIERDLNRSCNDIDPYHAVIYWRFLYEKCGGMVQNKEDPMRGMQIIYKTLSVLYSKEVVDIEASSELVENLPAIMDLAIQDTGSCPFENYRDSIVQFASAIYSLQLENGRCAEPGKPIGCELFDPDQRYLRIPIPEYTYSGDELTLDSTKQTFPVGIKSSFGIDFFEINLTGETQGSAITIELKGSGDGEAEFALQVYKNKSRKSAAFHDGDLVLINNDQTSVKNGGHLAIKIPEINLSEFDQLGLIITRLDNREKIDYLGEYSITIHPHEGHKSD